MLRCVRNLGEQASAALLKRVAPLCTSMVLSALVALPAFAQDADQSPNSRYFEAWAGADASANVWLLYSGTTLSPFGDVRKDGLRLRFVGGYGEYSYGGKRPALNPAYTGYGDEPMILTPYKSFRASIQFADVLIGYQWQWGELTTKAFIGMSSIQHDIRPGDKFIIPADPADQEAGPSRTVSFNRASGHEIGLSGALEFWLNLGPDAYASVDLAWSDAHLTRSARTRVGHKIISGLSSGLEASFNLNRNGEIRLKNDELVSDVPLDYARFGGFARYAWGDGEVSASAGLLGDFTQGQSVYGTMNWVTQF